MGHVTTLCAVVLRRNLEDPEVMGEMVDFHGEK
jgi:hypothetical protein